MIGADVPYHQGFLPSKRTGEIVGLRSRRDRLPQDTQKQYKVP